MKIFEKWKNRETKKKLRARIAELESALFIDRAEIDVDRREVKTVQSKIIEPMNQAPPFFEEYAKDVLLRKICEELKDYIHYEKRYDDAIGRNIHVAEIKVVDMGVRDEVH